ncbi:hypothetical protein ACUNWD_20365 [Sunxiuqinia sp. A32]|uniref:hypothetical protein n=1 Tax=Sunxiuqinia sp. A32 TaxID=3461496 RepID=UPI004046169B
MCETGNSVDTDVGCNPFMGFTSSITSPNRTDDFPMPPDGLPVSSNGIPTTTDYFPLLSDRFPIPSNEFPLLTNGIPKMSIGFPALSICIPLMTSRISKARTLYLETTKHITKLNDLNHFRHSKSGEYTYA